jgi:hypothetical protein
VHYNKLAEAADLPTFSQTKLPPQMKKLLIGAIVGGILVFAWQTVSWTVLGLHDDELQKAPNEDSIISYLSTQFSEDGQYMIPVADANASADEQQQFMENMKGKPWAIISYHKAYEADMVMNMIRGFVSMLIAAFFVCWILMKNTKSSFFSTFISCIMIGVAGYVFFPYAGIIWMESPGAKTYLLDAIAAWGLCGIWLGLWLNKK